MLCTLPQTSQDVLKAGKGLKSEQHFFSKIFSKSLHIHAINYHSQNRFKLTSFKLEQYFFSNIFSKSILIRAINYHSQNRLKLICFKIRTVFFKQNFQKTFPYSCHKDINIVLLQKKSDFYTKQLFFGH